MKHDRGGMDCRAIPLVFSANQIRSGIQRTKKARP